jgi:cell fate (sporulation/competence/biofilm development) regulator YmcA (YheA/YmcA/DUF963 family)
MAHKGQRSITLQMDVPRSLKWTFSAIDRFEQLAKEELISQKIIKEEAQVQAESVINNFLGNTAILKLAFACALVDSKPDDPDLEMAAKAIDGLLENSGSLQDVIRAIQESFFLVVRPLQAAFLKKSWIASDELDEVKREEALLKAKDEMKKAKENIKTLGGKKSKESASSNLASTQEISGV